MENKVIVVTGASSGVGKNICEKFVKLGWSVYGIARNINSIPDGVTRIQADISDNESVEKAFFNINKIDVLINNASIFINKPFIECYSKDINNIIDTNVKGYMFCTLNAIKKMSKGRVINIGSVSGTHGIKNQAIYSASKFAISGFTDSLAQEHIGKILFTTINPGGINTDLWNENNPYDGDTEDLLKVQDITTIVEQIIFSSPKMVTKNITIFPTNEWH